ncbi:hypothetical protein MDA_GLEAN10013464 [Myotis davidii]|uniref:Uncharacterized protein n=1 Tax=Myotis davidii TaxID=225400 RepID=L5LUV3_MYODS|nr:hypothetical protein MDA_GLEAN10013464 [Myotis davidii]
MHACVQCQHLNSHVFSTPDTRHCEVSPDSRPILSTQIPETSVLAPAKQAQFTSMKRSGNCTSTATGGLLCLLNEEAAQLPQASEPLQNGFGIQAAAVGDDALAPLKDAIDAKMSLMRG